MNLNKNYALDFSWLKAQVLVHGLERSEIRENLELLRLRYLNTPIGQKKISAFTPESVSSYLQFYGATNAYKFNPLINKLPLWVQDLMVNSPFIDMGAGPSIFSLCFDQFRRNFLEKKNAITQPKEWLPILSLESDSLMMSQGKKLLASYIEDSKVDTTFHFSASVLPNMATQFQQGSLFFGHSYNEISDEQFQKLLTIFKPRILIFVEPGTKEVFHRLVKLRSELIKLGHEVIYPCLAKSTCPMDQHDSKDWCHQILHLSFDPELESLCQYLKKR